MSIGGLRPIRSERKYNNNSSRFQTLLKASVRFLVSCLILKLMSRLNDRGVGDVFDP